MGKGLVYLDNLWDNQIVHKRNLNINIVEYFKRNKAADSLKAKKPGSRLRFAKMF